MDLHRASLTVNLRNLIIGSIISNTNNTTNGATMHTQKLSISVPMQQYEFIEHYQKEHHFKSRSEVISEALRLLQLTQLEACYKEANSEIDHDFDATISDGIDEDETW